MTSDAVTVTAREVTSAAAMVDLPLSEADADEAVGLLSAWMPAAIALSTRMQQVEDLSPITTFATLTGLQSEETS